VDGAEGVDMDRLGAFPSLAAVFSDLGRLGVAYALSLPIAWDREREGHSAGLRTFPIVAAASCGLAMIGTSFSGASPDAYSRILQGLVTGIGFIGGGAILRDRGSVSGTATAASVWCVGIVGAAVGFGMYHIAVVLSLVDFLTLRFLLRLKLNPGPRAGAPRPADDESRSS
jgi:putative Mg2+ transporter-C (MgtC) family protein